MTSTIHSSAYRTSALAWVLLLLAVPLRAQTTAPAEITPERIAEQIDADMDQLDLTETQRETVRPIMESAFAERLAVMEKHGVDPAQLQSGKRPGLRTLRRMKKDMDALNKSTEEELNAVLTDEQMEQWRAIEKERQDRMRAQLRGKG
ncbi:MAG: hypothetical protein AAF730_17705 [Bacteroidota bacterium]